MNGFTLFLIAVLAFIVFWIIITRVGGAALTRRRVQTQTTLPSDFKLAYEEVSFPARDGTPLVGWWIPAPNAHHTLIVCHGYNGTMDTVMVQAAAAVKAGFNVFTFDSRAHGRSGGEVISFGMGEKEDLLGALDFLRGRGIERPGVWGFSMGAATALIAAAVVDGFAGVVADSPYAYLKNTLARQIARRGIPYPIGWQFAAWSLVAAAIRTRGRLDQVDPILWVQHVRCPALIIGVDRDPFVTESELRALAGKTTPLAACWIVPGTGHATAFIHAPRDYLAQLRAFIGA